MLVAVLQFLYPEVLLNGTVVGTGSGHSKKEAEQSAAKAALAAMGET